MTRSAKPSRKKKKRELPRWILDLQERHKKATRKQLRKILQDVAKYAQDDMERMEK